MRPGRVCSRCWRDAPCPIHSRPKNARWSKDRDGATQNRWARAVKQRDDHTCQMPGPHEGPLAAHHIRPGWRTEDGITLCRKHHKEIDEHAR